MSKGQLCEPCRTSGYKCNRYVCSPVVSPEDILTLSNRQRPCSSCVLQGKKTDCYAGSASFAPPSISSSSGISLTPVEPTYASDALQAVLSSETDDYDVIGSTKGRVLGRPIGRSGAEGEGLYAGATSFLAQLRFGTDMVRSQTWARLDVVVTRIPTAQRSRTPSASAGA